MNRVCKRCGIEKPIDNYTSHKRFCATDYICNRCKVDLNRIYRKRYYNNNRIKIVELQKKLEKNRRNELNSWYVADSISRNYKISRKVVLKMPEFIESYRYQIKIKRLLKQKKHENTKTS